MWPQSVMSCYVAKNRTSGHVMRCHVMSCQVIRGFKAMTCHAWHNLKRHQSRYVMPSLSITSSRHILSTQVISSPVRQVQHRVNTKLNELTAYEINIIRPRSSFAVPTSIGSSILLKCHVSSRTCRTPSLMLNCKGFVTTPGGCCKALVDGGGSSSVEATDDDVFAIHLWNCSTAGVSETANRFYCKEYQNMSSLTKKGSFFRKSVSPRCHPTWRP